MTRAEVTEIVNNFSTKDSVGFTPIEQTLLLMMYFYDIDLERYYEAMRGNTVAVIDGTLRAYHCDVITAIMYALED